MLNTSARPIVLALAMVALVSSSSSDKEPQSQPSTYDEAPRGTAARTTSGAAPAPRDFDQILLEDLAEHHLVGAQAPPFNSTAMREAFARAVTTMLTDQGAAVAATVERTTLALSVFGGDGCTMAGIRPVVTTLRDPLRKMGFTRVKCEPEGYTLPVR